MPKGIPQNNTTRITSVRSNPIDGLGDALVQAARASGKNEYEMGIALTYLCEAIMEQVVLGRPVTIPGFGQFGPRPCKNELRVEYGAPSCAHVAFYANYQWQMRVARETIPDWDVCGKILSQYMKNHRRAGGRRSKPRPSRPNRRDMEMALYVMRCNLIRNADRASYPLPA